MATGDDIEERLIKFAVRIIKVADSLPKTPAGKHISDQLLRAGTAPAFHYGEGRSAESRRDFAHKLRVALKEMNETRICLLIIIRSGMLPESILADLLKECIELCKIFQTSIRTTQGSTRPT